MRLIDADALREGWLEWDIYDEIEANTVLYSIDDQPTINPEDLRPKGQWIERVGIGEWICSECQHEIYLPFGETPEEIGTNYCPNCGAKMEE